jgi:hypothetical protein
MAMLATGRPLPAPNRYQAMEATRVRKRTSIMPDSPIGTAGDPVA